MLLSFCVITEHLFSLICFACLAMVRGTTLCRGCGISYDDDLLLPKKAWHGSVCSICHCLNCSSTHGFRGHLPRRNSAVNPEFSAASRDRRGLALSRESRLRARVAVSGPRVLDWSDLVPEIDVCLLAPSDLIFYYSELLSRLRLVAEELRLRTEARFALPAGIGGSC